MNVSETVPLLIRQLYDIETGTCTYLIVDRASEEAVIIDPVKANIDRDLRLIEELGAELRYTMETHVHADHVTGSGLIRQRTGASVVYSAAAQVSCIDIAVSDLDELPLGCVSIKVLSTPGHTAGCISYYVDGAVFTGDALFVRGCGRTDFQEGDAGRLYDSVTGKLFTLPEDTCVYPGHDYTGRLSSTIGEEINWNPRLNRQISRSEFIEIMMNLHLAVPKKMNEAVPVNAHCGELYEANRYVQAGETMESLYSRWMSLSSDELIVDVRHEHLFVQGHIPGALNIPEGRELEYIDSLRKWENIYLYSQTGRAAQTVFTTLLLAGLDNTVCIAHGGFPEWKTRRYPIECDS